LGQVLVDGAVAVVVDAITELVFRDGGVAGRPTLERVTGLEAEAGPGDVLERARART